MRVAVIGSRDYPDLRIVRRFMRGLKKKYPDVTVISGGGRGVEAIAESESERMRLDFEIIRPNCRDHAENAWDIRNDRIIDEANIVMVFWDDKDVNMIPVVERARSKSKQVFVYDQEGELVHA